MTYNVIYADPPWTFKTYSPKGKDRSPEKHYPTMSFKDICALPIKDWASENCVLLLWVTDPQLPKGLELMNTWGFTYKTVGFYWIKENKKSPGFFTGLGYWTRANPEQCLLGTRGNPKRQFKDVPRLLVSPRREHSRKPDEIYPRIERLLAGPYLELFGRTQRSGWTTLGNETQKFPNL